MGKLSFLKSKESRNAGWMIGGKVAQMVLSLLVGVITARYLGPGNYGLVTYGAAWVAFFTAFSSLGTNSVVVKEFIDHPDAQGETIGSVLLLRLAASLLSVALIFLMVFVVDHGEKLTITVVLLCSLGLVFHIFETFNYWFQAQYKSKITAMATLAAYIGMSAYKIILLMQGKDVRWFAFATSVDYIVVAVFLWIAYKRHGGTPLRFSFQRAKAILGSSYHYILSGMMVAIYGQTDKLMLKQMLNESEVAYYSVAVAICGMWTFVLKAIIDALYPTIIRLHGKDQKAFEQKNRLLYAIVFYVSMLVSVAFLVLGDFGVRLLYGADYASAGSVLKVITWYTAFSYLGVARNAWIVSEGKQKYLKYMYFGAAILNVVLNYVCIPVWGAVGAAIASLTTQVFTSIILPMFFKEMRPNANLMIEAILLKNVFKSEEK